MIIVSLSGGLGNQMFQYAAGRRLSLRHNTQLRLDVSMLAARGVRTPRDYELKHLAVKSEIATPDEIRFVRQGAGGLKGVVAGAIGLVSSKAQLPGDYLEKQFNFDQDFDAVPDDRYLIGYWQSEKYFSGCEAEIRADFRFVYPLEGRNRELAAAMAETESVSLHVRRGDYISDPQVATTHGACGLLYYDRAIATIAKKTQHPHFFVFSDDPVWVQENLRIPFPATYVTENGGKGYEDLRLMSLCRHNVIANSSFSWWGAWLNVTPGKTIVAPARWFSNPTIDTADLIPEKWLRITE